MSAILFAMPFVHPFISTG